MKAIDADRLSFLLQENFSGSDGAAIMKQLIDNQPTIDLESMFNSRWISVEDFLPDKPGTYLVAYHPCYWDRVSTEIDVGVDSFRGKSSWAKKKYQRVTHWMPLPDAPRCVKMGEETEQEENRK